MKKLLILSIVAVLTAGSVGCCGHRLRNWWHRGAVCTPPVISSMAPVECCPPGCDESGDYYGGYLDGAELGCTPYDSGVPVTTHNSGFVDPESSRATPEPANDS